MKNLAYLGLLAGVTGVVGCMTSSPHSTLDMVENEIAAKFGGGASRPAQDIPLAMSPFVEGIIEFGGPSERWSGPQPMVMSVNARDAASTAATTPPAAIVEHGTPPSNHATAAGTGTASAEHAAAAATAIAPQNTAELNEKSQKVFAKVVVSPAILVGGRAIASEHGDRGVENRVAREKLQALAQSLATDTPDFSGCLYPVRVRLVREDGSILEKAGCRGQKGWPRLASQTLAEILEIQSGGIKQGGAKAGAAGHAGHEKAETQVERAIASEE